MQEQHEGKSGDVQYIRKANHILLVDPNRFDTAALDTVAMNENENELGRATCAIQINNRIWVPLTNVPPGDM